MMNTVDFQAFAIYLPICNVTTGNSLLSVIGRNHNVITLNAPSWQ